MHDLGFSHQNGDGGSKVETRVVQSRDREKHVFAQTKRVFGPNETVFVTKGNETKQ